MLKPLKISDLPIGKSRGPEDKSVRCDGRVCLNICPVEHSSFRLRLNVRREIIPKVRFDSRSKGRFFQSRKSTLQKLPHSIKGFHQNSAVAPERRSNNSLEISSTFFLRSIRANRPRYRRAASVAYSQSSSCTSEFLDSEGSLRPWRPNSLRA